MDDPDSDETLCQVDEAEGEDSSTLLKPLLLPLVQTYVVTYNTGTLYSYWHSILDVNTINS